MTKVKKKKPESVGENSLPREPERAIAFLQSGQPIFCAVDGNVRNEKGRVNTVQGMSSNGVIKHVDP